MRKTRNQERQARQQASRRKTQLLAAMVITLICVVSVTLIAQVSSRKKKQNASDQVSIASFDPNQPAKEYIYAGSRLVATEEPTPSCSYSISPLSSPNFPASGGNGSVSVTASAGCAWTAVSNNGFIIITSGSSGSDNGTVAYTVQSNGSQSQRSGTITVTGTATGIQFTHTVTQDGSSCSYSLPSSSSSLLPAAGQSGVTFSVTASAGCSWSPATSDSWITITSGTGTGNGTVTYSVSANASQSQRAGTITVTGTGAQLTYTVNQAGGCGYSLPVSSSQAPPTAVTGATFSVSASAGCSWSPSTSDSWITITSGAMSGNGTVTYNVSANTSQSQRTGTITVTGTGAQLTYTVTQGYGTKITPVSATASNQITGNEASKAIDGSLGTYWNAGNFPPQWIQIDLGQTYSISEIRLSVAQLPDGVTNHEIWGGPLTTSMSLLRTLNGFTSSAQWLQADFSPAASNVRYLKVNTTVSPSYVAWQEIEVYVTCSYSITPASQQFVPAGGTGSVAVTADTGCGWSATSNNAWIHVTGGSPGTGSGSVSYSVDSNTGPVRSGSITIANQTFTVNQDSGCTFSLNPPGGANYSISGGSGSVAVTAGSLCSWTAVSNNSWITVTSGANGTGNGTVNYTVSSNSGAARSGSITIAGQTFTVTQDGIPVSCQVSTFAGSGVAGYGEGTGVSNKWSAPVGAVLGKSPITGNPDAIFIADTMNNRIRLVYLGSGTSALIAGNGTAGYSEGSGNPVNAMYNHPKGITATKDVNGVVTSLLVADTDNHVIRKLAWSGSAWVPSLYSGKQGSAGYVDGSSSSSRYNQPQAISAASSSLIFAADTGNGKIRKLDQNGTSTTQSAAGISSPVGVTINLTTTNLIYVSDQTLHKIFQVNTSTNAVTLLAGNGTAGFANGTGTGAQFNSPRQLTWTSGDVLFIADLNNLRVRKLIAGTQVVTTLAGTGAQGNADGDCTTTATFRGPQGIAAFGPSGELYVVDSADNKIRKIQP